MSSSRSFDLFNSIIYQSRWSVDSRWLFDHRCYIHLRWSCFLWVPVIFMLPTALRASENASCFKYFSNWVLHDQEKQLKVLPKVNSTLCRCKKTNQQYLHRSFFAISKLNTQLSEIDFNKNKIVKSNECSFLQDQVSKLLPKSYMIWLERHKGADSPVGS